MNDLFISVGNEIYSGENLGGKADYLVKMQRAEFNVPLFFVIPCTTINKLLLPVNTQIERLINSLAKDGSSHLESVCQEIQKIISDLELEDDFISNIHQACDVLFPKGTLFAVRSSGGSEDSNNASFAGQHASFLFVDKEQIASNIKACIASAWSHGALSYRLAKNISIHQIEYAVIVQEMIRSAKSGVSFSMNVGGNLADAIIIAGYGLGEGIVQGRTETDSYTVNRQTGQFQKLSIQQQIEMRPEFRKLMISIEGADVSKQEFVLSDGEIMAIHALTMKAEYLLHDPVDIEFAIDDAGEIFILQMRPITTIDKRMIKILDNTNIVESFPGITLPLTFSFVNDAYEKVFSSCSEVFFIPDKVVKQKADIFRNLLGHYYGRIYYQLDNWYRMMAMVYSSPRSITAWENAVGLLHSERDKVSFSLQSHIRTTLVFIWLILNYFRGNRRFFRLFGKHYDQLRNITSFKGNASALWVHYESVTAKLFKPWHLTLINDFLSFTFFGWLQKALFRLKLADSGSLANDLLCGIKGVESEEALVSFLTLKDQIRGSDQLSKLFNSPVSEIVDRLNQTEFLKINRMINRHLEYFGDRTLAELKLETTSMRNNKASFVQMLKDHLSINVDVDTLRKRQQEIQKQAWNIVYERVHWWNPLRYLLFGIRNIAAYGLRSRENMRFCRTRAFSGVKNIFLEVGSIMSSEGVIDEKEDIFWLSVDDLKKFCKGDRSQELKEVILKNKKDYHLFEQVSPPDRVIYMNNELPVLNVRFETHIENKASVQGIAVSKGIVTAEAAVVLKPDFTMDIRGKILISQMTDPGWVFLMMQAAGLICEKGSLLSHTAIVGRELGIPVIMGVSGATTIFKDGEQLTMNGSTGVIEKLTNSNKAE